MMPQVMQPNLHPCSEELTKDIHACTRCPLNQSPYNPGLPTIGIGSLFPKLMIIGEAPGAAEAQEGRPFIGKSGQLLQTVLKSLNISLEDIYVTNIVKHRPPENRDPTVSELAECLPWFLQELDQVQPKAILCTGKISAKVVSSLAGIQLPASGLRGTVFKYNNIPVLITWHPAYVLRNQTKYNDLVSDVASIIKVIN